MISFAFPTNKPDVLMTMILSEQSLPHIQLMLKKDRVEFLITGQGKMNWAAFRIAEHQLQQFGFTARFRFEKETCPVKMTWLRHQAHTLNCSRR